LKKFLLLTIIFFLIPSNLWATAAFPGAEGYGSTTTHAFGGINNPFICIVNTVADNNTEVTKTTRNGATVYTGSLRECLTDTDYAGDSGPSEADNVGRIVIFETSGTIDLTTLGNIKIQEPWCYVAGQTSPEPGIQLKGATLDIRDHDVVIQHIRMRPGDSATGPNPDDRDALYIRDTVDVDPPANVVIDHISAEWSTDEIISVYDTYTPKQMQNITLSNNIFAQSLKESIHSKGSHSMGPMLYGTDGVSVMRNIIAHHWQRDPMANSINLLFANNIIYNFNTSGANLRATDSTGTISYTSNLFRRGLDTGNTYVFYHYSDTYTATSSSYLGDNRTYTDGLPADQWDAALGGLNYMNDQTSEAARTDTQNMTVAGITIWSSADLFANLLQTSPPTSNLYSVGAYPAYRDSDAIDAGVISDVLNGTGHWVDCVIDTQCDPGDTDAGDWPNLATNSITHSNMPASPYADGDTNGYPDIMDWIFHWSNWVEGISATMPTIVDPTANETNWDYTTPEPMDITVGDNGIHYATDWKVTLAESDCDGGTSEGTQSLCDTSNKTSYAYPNLSPGLSYKLCVRTYVDWNGNSSCDVEEATAWATQLFSTGAGVPVAYGATMDESLIGNCGGALCGATMEEVLIGSSVGIQMGE